MNLRWVENHLALTRHARSFLTGYDVTVVDDLSNGSLGNLANARSQPDRKFSFHRMDVASPGVMDLIGHRRPDVVFHLAAQADVRVSVARPECVVEALQKRHVGVQCHGRGASSSESNRYITGPSCQGTNSLWP